MAIIKHGKNYWLNIRVRGKRIQRSLKTDNNELALDKSKEKSVDFVTISEILGHSKLTTSLIYSHTDKERKKRAVNLL